MTVENSLSMKIKGGYNYILIVLLTYSLRQSPYVIQNNPNPFDKTYQKLDARAMLKVFNRYVCCLLDVLGFESQFNALGLEGLLEKYLQLIEVVARHNAPSNLDVALANFPGGDKDTALWTVHNDGQPAIFIFNKIFATYASDSILIFAYADFPAAQYPAAESLSHEEMVLRSKHPGSGWQYHPVPCDNFLDACSDVICHSLEIGLPLRGAISMGEAVLNPHYGVFIGRPLIEAARLEKEQSIIGAAISTSFMSQTVPHRYLIEQTDHFKTTPHPTTFSGNMLDWPRYWRATRQNECIEIVDAMNNDQRFTKYYQNTKATIRKSREAGHLYQGREYEDIICVYPQFSGGPSVVEAQSILVRAGDVSNKPDDNDDLA